MRSRRPTDGALSQLLLLTLRIPSARTRTSLSHTQTHKEDAGASADSYAVEMWGVIPPPRPKGVHSKLVKRHATCALLMTRPIVIPVWRANHW
ncbi:hypothetical protein CPAR01_04944 [Colletotrichum paranaense]|uniref:Secreted protein n=4 Tax=Colletotrichum acutatum species complex TaxID=2707335 RepID=A0AAI9TZI7_9PEZI|nr:uncharacterized protein CPAR01_04944 [Colletotrichum paranaense]XP_060386731.1 uncharacterized protein CTAM01_02890 [Colletotrichum tamarilloi]KAK1447727.1 hypothetical protein CMEL01_09566 [Colletotrichum melonis]KAK1465399.1 hypothetical protein CCUS01_07516 [Colletotrichum cuscutae]KAK1507778.1 hypothetical protein CTAM01_02890 [Colletotrichum tamarilloi]KAK1544311.1 hypothetical protein CPAR01_04944 [Colletotrichum paranaense]